MDAQQAYVLSKRYTKESLLGAGAIQGEDGVGILQIEKTSTNGLTDTYTVFLTDGSHYELKVTNGKDGAGNIESISVNGRVIEPDALRNVDIPIPTSLPASDVYDWAKNPQKPIYTAEEVGADEKGSAQAAEANAKSYTDDKLQELIGTSPENLDTIYELAQALLDNQEAVDAINGAITNKVDKIPGMGLSHNDLTNELIQKWDAKSDFSGSYNDLTDKPEMVVEIDTVMSDTSENPVQNKVIKEYVDGSVGAIKKFQRFVNTELDYAYLRTSLTNNLTLSNGIVIPFDTVVEGKGIEIDSQKYGVVLKNGKTYKLSCSIRISSTAGYITAGFYSVEKEEFLSMFSKVTSNYNVGSDNGCGFLAITPAMDTTVQIKVAGINGTPTITTAGNDYASLIVEEINRSIVIDPVEYVNTQSGIEDTPVGHIISYMGITAPKHYLVCDGTEYNIADYPYLAQHFIDDFGSVNYFGGDGETTFAVPDLRGEFLRGAGEATRATGAGGEVGQHQEPTKHIWTQINPNNNIVYPKRGTKVNPEYPDKHIPESQTTRYTNVGSSDNATFYTNYTSRPTNTSVLYCIKYEPTYFMKMADHIYSYEERLVGTWVDGKPLYEKTVNFGALPNATTKEVPHGIENADVIWIHDGFSQTSTGEFAQLNAMGTNSLSQVIIFMVDHTKIISITGTNRLGYKSYVTLRYTKTTDQPLI